MFFFVKKNNEESGGKIQKTHKKPYRLFEIICTKNQLLQTR